MDELTAFEDNPENIDSAFTGFANVDTWLKHVERCSHSLCRIEIPGGTAQGTGFLLQPGTIITNYHVMQPVIDDPSLHSSVVVRFGFQTTLGDRGLSAGIECELADTNWLKASSPTGELDFAIVRIRAISTNPVNAANITLYRLTPEEYYTFRPGEALCILQHPLGNAQQIKWGSVVRINSDDTRVYYTTETLKGSSGAPCFNSDMKVVALHQGNQSSNEKKGIPFPTIMTYLHQHYPEIFSKIIAKQDASVLLNMREQCNCIRDALQYVDDVFHSEKDISGDKRFLSYQSLKEARGAMQSITEELSNVQVIDTSLHYRLLNEQTYFSIEAGNLMISLQDFSRQITSTWLRNEVQHKLVPLLYSLETIEQLISLFGKNLL